MKPNISLRELLPTPTMLAISLRNLKRSRTRTVLSALGIIIGVFAICSLGMAGAAFTMSINDMLEENTSMLLMALHLKSPIPEILHLKDIVCT